VAKKRYCYQSCGCDDGSVRGSAVETHEEESGCNGDDEGGFNGGDSGRH